MEKLAAHRRQQAASLIVALQQLQIGSTSGCKLFVSRFLALQGFGGRVVALQGLPGVPICYLAIRLGSSVVAGLEPLQIVHEAV